MSYVQNAAADIAIRWNLYRKINRNTAIKTALLHMCQMGRPLRQTTLGEKLVEKMEDLGLVSFYPDFLVYLTDVGINTVAALKCRSHNHDRLCCWGLVITCPLCGLVHCMEDGAGDDLDDRFPGLCDDCAFGITKGNPDAFP